VNACSPNCINGHCECHCLPLTKKIKIVLDNLLKSAIIKLPKERAVTAESATSNLLGCQEKKELV